MLVVVFAAEPMLFRNTHRPRSLVWRACAALKSSGARQIEALFRSVAITRRWSPRHLPALVAFARLGALGRGSRRGVSQRSLRPRYSCNAAAGTQKASPELCAVSGQRKSFSG